MKQKCSVSKSDIIRFLSYDFDVLCFDSIDSTNNEAKRIATSADFSPTLIVANHQSAGRGRLGRSFYSPKDTGLYMSLLIKPIDNMDIVHLTCAVAVYVCQAINELCDIKPMIKWVNDIYLHNKKIAGILCESVTDKSNNIKALIIGIGINITTDDFPDDIKDTAASLNTQLDINKLCAAITDKLYDYILFGDCDIINKYKAKSLVLNKEITYTKDNVTQTATATDIDSNGGLITQNKNGEYITLNSGEITVRLT